jgi:threonine synthase
MLYVSTRGGAQPLSPAASIVRGLAGDGGLLVPQEAPKLGKEAASVLCLEEYRRQARVILSLYLDDYTGEELEAAVGGAYGEEVFPDGPAVFSPVADGLGVLELWRGPTLAFKDLALQLLPRLLSLAVNKAGEKKQAVILTATSGDTGKAALAGFSDAPGTKIVVFYPAQGVSSLQKRQMTTQNGGNLHVSAVEGNFDDAQGGVKRLFADEEFARRMSGQEFFLSSANSINWGRLVPQIVYYFYAYGQAVRRGRIKNGDEVNFAVPTGNFGNILAGFYAKTLGLPAGRFICASNANNVLTEFIHTGRYNSRRKFYKTISPSMDILVSSNLERLLHYLTAGDAPKVAALMTSLAETGRYDLGEEGRRRLAEHFYACWADDRLTKDIIAAVFRQYKYLLDPHTAVAWQAALRYRAAADKNYTIILSTASPFKFAPAVLDALRPGLADGLNDFDALRKLSDLSGIETPRALSGLDGLPVRFGQTVAAGDMRAAVEKFLRLD